MRKKVFTLRYTEELPIEVLSSTFHSSNLLRIYFVYDGVIWHITLVGGGCNPEFYLGLGISQFVAVWYAP